jgi:hypothetical protein
MAIPKSTEEVLVIADNTYSSAVGRAACVSAGLCDRTIYLHSILGLSPAGLAHIDWVYHLQ